MADSQWWGLGRGLGSNGGSFASARPQSRDLPMNGASLGFDAATRLSALGITGGGGVRTGTSTQLGAGAPTAPLGDIYRGMGKTNVALPTVGPPTTGVTQLEPLQPREGIVKTILQGLTEQFTGILPQDIRQHLVNAVGLVGAAADLPIEFAGHLPLPWVPDVQQAFAQLPETDQMQRIREQMLVDPNMGLRYMAQYVRDHEQEYMAALQLPRILSPFFMPDANILERVIGIPGIPQQMIARTFAGLDVRDVDRTVLNADPATLSPALRDIQQKYKAGKLTHDQVLDEITQVGMAFTNDPFMNFFLSVATDPVIVGGFGTGLAARAFDSGTLALRTANALERLRATPEGAAVYDASRARALGQTVDGLRRTSPGVAEEELVRRATAMADDTARGRFGKMSRAGEFNRMIANDLRGTAPDLLARHLDQATAGMTRTQRAIIHIEPVVAGAAKISHAINNSFGVFGRDKPAELVQALRSNVHTRRVVAFYGNRRMAAILGTPSVNRDMVETSLGVFSANSEAGLIHQKSLVRTLRASGVPEGITAETPLTRIRETGAVQRSIMEIESDRQLARTAPTYVVDTSHITDPKAAEAYRNAWRDGQESLAAQRLVYSTGMTIEDATRLTRNADDKMLGLAEALAYGKAVRDLLDGKTRDVTGLAAKLEKAVAEGDTAAETEIRAQQAMLPRYTLVGARELTSQDAAKLLKVARGNAADAVQQLRAAIDRYDVLYQNFERLFDEDGKLIDDIALKDRMATFLEEGLRGSEDGSGGFVTVIEDMTHVPENVKAFLDRNKEVNGDAAYKLGIAPKPEDQWRVSHDLTGRLSGVNPWVDLVSDQAGMYTPTRLDAVRNALFSPIRGEKLLYESRNKFVKRATEDYNLARRDASRLFDAVRKAASEREIQPRGLTPGEFKAVTDSVIIPPEMKQRLGADGLTLLTAQAFEGDIMTVGWSSKATGQMKLRSAKWGNWVGIVAERIYPFVRFTANPFFQMQDWVEPYFFNILRGVRPGMQWTQEDRATLAMLDRWRVGTMFNDQAEYTYVAAQGWANTTLPGRFGKDGAIAADNVEKMGIRSVRERKMLNYIRATRAQGGINFRNTVLHSATPEFWDTLVREYGTTDAGSIAVRYWIDKGIFHPDDPNFQAFMAMASRAGNLGERARVNTKMLARALDFAGGEPAMRKAIAAGEFTEDQFRAHAVTQGWSEEFRARSWATASFPYTVDEWFGELNRLNRQTANATVETARMATDTARGLITAAATAKRMNLDEFMASEFTGLPLYLDSAGELPASAYKQTVIGMGNDIMEAYPELNLQSARPGTDRHTRIVQRVHDLFELPSMRQFRRTQEAQSRAIGQETYAPGNAGGSVVIPGFTEIPVGPQHELDVLRTIEGRLPVNSRETWATLDQPKEVVAAFDLLGQLLPEEDVQTLLAQHDRAALTMPMRTVPHRFTDRSFRGDETFIRDKAGLRENLGEYPADERGLYHVTTAKEGVAELGLLSRGELRDMGIGRVGLGGGGLDVAPNTVSVTYSLQHAQLIQRRMKLAARAARGEATVADILDEFAPDIGEYAQDYAQALNLPGASRLAPDDWVGFDRLLYNSHFAETDGTITPAGRYQMIQTFEAHLSRMSTGIEEEPNVVGFTAPAAEMAKTDPESIRLLQVARKEDAAYHVGDVQHVVDERELRFRDARQSLYVLGDMDAPSGGARIQGTLQDLRQELAARMTAGYVASTTFDDTLHTMQLIGDLTDEMLRGGRAGEVVRPGGRNVERLREVVQGWRNVPRRGSGDAAYDRLDAITGRALSGVGLHRRSLDPTQRIAPVNRWVMRGLGFVDKDYAEAIAYHLVQSGEVTTIEEGLARIRAQMGVTEFRDPTAAEMEGARTMVQSLAAQAKADRTLQWRDWSGTDMAQAIAETARRGVGLPPTEEMGTTLRRGFQSTIHFDVAPAGRQVYDLHAPIDDTHAASKVPWDKLTYPQQQAVTRPLLAMARRHIEQATGVRIIDQPTFIPGLWRDGTTGTAVAPASSWTMIGLTDKAVEDAMDLTGLIFQQDEVRGIQEVGGTVARAARGEQWAMDVRPRSAVHALEPRVYAALSEYLMDSVPDLPGYMSARDLEGRQVFRTLWDHTGTASLDDIVAGHQFSAEVYAALNDGTWTRKLGHRFRGLRNTDIPMETDHKVVRVKRASNRLEGYPDGSTWEHQRGIARGLTEQGVPEEQAYGQELGSGYRQRLAARGSTHVLEALDGGLLGTAKREIDDIWEQVTGEPTQRKRGQQRLARLGGAGRGRVLEQRGPRGTRGATAYSEGTKSTLYLLKDADASTGVHELAHVFGRWLDPSARENIMAVYRGERPGRRGTTWSVHHEEWFARQFESYVAGGTKLAPTPALKAIFNAFGTWARRTLKASPTPVDKRISDIFDSWFTGHDPAEPAATFDADQYRWIRSIEDGMMRGEEVAHTNHYYRRGRSWTERSVNHPYLGMYPASYMWGKVLPELVRFMAKEPFGVAAPFAGLQLAKHAAFYSQLMIQTNPDFQQFVEDHPETVRFLALMLPGTPWENPRERTGMGPPPRRGRDAEPATAGAGHARAAHGRGQDRRGHPQLRVPDGPQRGHAPRHPQGVAGEGESPPPSVIATRQPHGRSFSVNGRRSGLDITSVTPQHRKE